MAEKSHLEILTDRHRRLHVVLIIFLIFTVIGFLFDLGEIANIYSPNAGDPNADPSALDFLYALWAFGQIITFIFAVIFWCMWIHRAAANIIERGDERFGFTAGWAVGWHFIPFANLFQPFAVMRQIWNISVTGADVEESAPTVNLWWLTYIGAGLFGNFSAQILFRSEDPGAIYFAAILSGISSALMLVSLPTAIGMLRTITKGQLTSVG